MPRSWAEGGPFGPRHGQQICGTCGGKKTVTRQRAKVETVTEKKTGKTKKETRTVQVQETCPTCGGLGWKGTRTR